MLRLREKFLLVELTERLKMLEGGEPGLTQSKGKLMAFSVSHLFFPVTWNTFFLSFCFCFFFAIFALQQLPLIVSNY